MDGAARTPLFLQSELARHANLNRVWFLSYHFMPESIFQKSFGCRWDRTQNTSVVSSASNRFIHYAMASRVDQNFINTLKKVDPSFWKKRGNDFV